MNTRAVHLSDLEGSKNYQISLCRQVPMNISEANVVYINSIINPKESTIRESNSTIKTLNDADADEDHNSDVYRVVNIERHQVTSSIERRNEVTESNFRNLCCAQWEFY